MTLWAVVPVKPFRQAKSRLAVRLGEAERIELSRRMLSQTVQVLQAISQISAVAVVSADRAALELAEALGARPLVEPEPPDLNRALGLARATAETEGATALLVVASDLPRLTPADLQALLGRAGRPPGLVIAPDRQRAGTNALWVSPPALIEFQFGAESFARHLESARRAGAAVEICDLPALALDLDSPQDFELARGQALSLSSKE